MADAIGQSRRLFRRIRLHHSRHELAGHLQRRLAASSDTAATELADIVGWVTIQNRSGTDFRQATIQLMAGDVAKIRDLRPRVMMANSAVAGLSSGSGAEVTQKAFDDFHVYDLHRTFALHDNETKQLQFLEATKVIVQRTYQYDGSNIVVPVFCPGFHNDQQYNNSGNANTRVAILQEIKNSESNHLGMPLPAGRLRL